MIFYVGHKLILLTNYFANYMKKKNFINLWRLGIWNSIAFFQKKFLIIIVLRYSLEPWMNILLLLFMYIKLLLIYLYLLLFILYVLFLCILSCLLMNVYLN